MTLVVVTSSFPISSDGSEAAGSFVADLVQELSKSTQVVVVAPGMANEQHPWGKNISVVRYKAPAQALSTLKLWRMRDVFSIVQVLRAGSRATRRAVSTNGVTHVLALWALPCGYWAKVAAKAAGIPYSIWTLGSDIWSLGRLPVIRQILSLVLKNAQQCYSDGVLLAKETQKIAGRDVSFLPSARRHEARPSTDVRNLPPYRISFVGRWHPNKGIDLLLEALGAMNERDWQKIERVTIAGGGDMHGLVQRAVEHLKLAGRPIDLKGYLNNAQLAEMLDATDFLMIPSRIESIPLVLSDALAFRRPIIATPVGDFPELMAAHHVGCLAEAVSASAICKAIQRALNTGPDPYIPSVINLSEQFNIGNVAETLLRDSGAT